MSVLPAHVSPKSVFAGPRRRRGAGEGQAGGGPEGAAPQRRRHEREATQGSAWGYPARIWNKYSKIRILVASPRHGHQVSWVILNLITFLTRYYRTASGSKGHRVVWHLLKMTGFLQYWNETLYSKQGPDLIDLRQPLEGSLVGWFFGIYCMVKNGIGT